MNLQEKNKYVNKITGQRVEIVQIEESSDRLTFKFIGIGDPNGLFPISCGAFESHYKELAVTEITPPGPFHNKCYENKKNGELCKRMNIASEACALGGHCCKFPNPGDTPFNIPFADTLDAGPIDNNDTPIDTRPVCYECNKPINHKEGKSFLSHDFHVECLFKAKKKLEILNPGKIEIKLNKHELQSGINRQHWVEALILQLPNTHDGRNSWLLNYGIGEEAVSKRLKKGIKWDKATESAETVGTPLQPIFNTASHFLQVADDTMKQRGKTYDKQDGGESERSMGKTIKAFNEITGRDLKESEGWLLMLILKQTRQWSKDEYHEDSALDSVAYSALLAEALSNENVNRPEKIDVCEQYLFVYDDALTECPNCGSEK